MIRSIAFHRLILPLLLALSLAAHAAGWDQREFDGRSYVSVESIKRFYHFDKFERRGKDLVLENRKVEIKLRDGGYECLMNGVKFVFSYPVVSSGGRSWVSKIDLLKLVDPVLRPADIKAAGNFRTVVIDAGHGGKDAGATNSLGREANYNLGIARRLQKILEDPKLGYRVVMTREDNRYLTLQQRVDIANAVTGNAIFISIHHNSGNSHARGIETFTLSPVGVAHYGSGLKSSDFLRRTGNVHDSANVALATAVHGVLMTTLKDKKSGKAYTLDRGIKRARFSVLSGVRHPSILVECGFMTHPYEGRLINDPGYQNTVAKSIAAAIQKYRFAVTSSTTQPGRRP